MLWPQCLHDWIWYFSRGCRQSWRSLGMRDHRALWSQGRMSSSLVWVQRHGPSHPWLFLKVHCVTNHSRQPPTHKLENDNPRDSCCSLRSAVKMEWFYFCCTSEEPWLLPPWVWASGRLWTCQVCVNQQVRLSTSVIQGQKLSGLCCHLLDCWWRISTNSAIAWK